MSSTRDDTNIAGGTLELRFLLFALALFGIILGEVTQIGDSFFWTIETDIMIGPLFIGLFFVVIASLLMLAVLLGLKVHWPLVIGVILFSLLASFVQGSFFPTDPRYSTPIAFLIYGSAIGVLSLILLGRVKSFWPLLWRVLLVTGAGSAIASAFIVFHRPDGLAFLVSVVVGILIFVSGYFLTRTARKAL